MSKNKVSVIIAAAGISTRMNGIDKQLAEIDGRAVLARTLEVFEQCENIDEIIVVTRKELFSFVEALIKEGKANKISRIIEGGATRQNSVFNGVKAVKSDADIIAIHDGARPFVDKEDICRCIDDAVRYGAAALGVKAKDTMKRVDEDGFIAETPERKYMYHAQTPQIFKAEIYRKAMERALKEEKEYSDDCAVVEADGVKVYITEGKYDNIKITTPEDISTAQKIAKEKGEGKMRIGQGYDAHRLAQERELVLGGVKIPHDKGLLGHSDADVLCHAISDAVLGAAALGDIGKHFPDSDEKYRGINSLIILAESAKKVYELGYCISNIDATIIAQKPKLAPYIEEMRKNIAEACGISADCVSVKATTEEKMGFTGKEEGISSCAVVLLA